MSLEAQPLGVSDYRPLDRTRLSGATEPIGPSTRRSGLVISEIMYHPAERKDGRNLEFIELFNSEAWFTDISGFRLGGDVDYVFPAQTIMPARSFLVLAAEPTEVAAVYNLQNVHGYGGSLPNGKGTVRLHNRQGAIVWEVKYSDESPWPAAADGAGHSLVLTRPSLGQRDPAAWTASDQPGGSPGSEESSSLNVHAGLFINEFLALPGANQQSFIEIFNYTDGPMSLEGLALTDDAKTNKFSFAAQPEIGARQFLNLTANQLGFAPDPKGGILLLREVNSGRVLDAVRFADQAQSLSMGRTPDGADDFSLLVEPTPGIANAARFRPEIVLNEIMFDPISGDSADEFVELHNRTGQPVNVGGWRLAGDIDFTFRAGTFIPANGFYVVSSDIQRLWKTYPQLNSDNSTGNYAGSLKNGRGRVQLLRSESVGLTAKVGSSRVDLQACKLEYSIVSPK